MRRQATDIALYLPSLRGGGAERVMVTLANGFATRGLRVDMVLAAAEGPYLNEVGVGVRIIDLRAHRVAASLPALVRYLRREQPQAMISALNHANVIAVAARSLARSRTQLLVSEHIHVTSSAAQTRSLKQRALTRLIRWAYRRADAIVAVSNGVADDLASAIGLSRSRVDVIHNPVVSPDLLARADILLAHPWLNGVQPPLVLAVGRLTPQKDFPTLIRAFSRVRSQRVCRLVILGEGESRQPLETLIERLGIGCSVQMPGFADNPYPWMRRASVFVLSSAWEGLGNVLIEAMACGTRVVSTDCPSGPREILEGGRWGPLVPVGDDEALANAIASQLDSPAREDARERSAFFSLQNALDRYLRLLGVENR